eukprot:4003349-Pleurochrysis_carterae.AAC.2
MPPSPPPGLTMAVVHAARSASAAIHAAGTLHDAMRGRRRLRSCDSGACSVKRPLHINGHSQRWCTYL